ncbi:pyridoxal 5'-phosphate synthase glutaminase subunit PdxT [Deinococcus sp. KNUC1210]|uniref:pyridoxal 5'-phosphate synthase glutaminase subunit PdxT n=1 Tax=Deinococcus sp. KNUC1210 TaxID=2917691 RepID=UPI001EF1580B|nr:pyridoxal 5'-phosphate synthase glutaminase subunit PdxT [Deinococcus sp. KNUC1210]ULH16128.1 pyridoxal 5'-phosphate synthase glutaminase subunit PdxT [Deinococcus sp. KNUC1210]
MPPAGASGKKLNIGVLALQGAFREHRRMLESLGAAVTEVRLPADLDGLNGLVIPGGESTTIGKLMMDYGLREPIRAWYEAGGSVFGTCAGAILLSRTVLGAPPQFGSQPGLDLMEMTVRRNAFGRQVDSFQAGLDVSGLETPFPAMFIRAPIIEAVGEGAEVLAQYHGEIVLARQGRLLASSFHPELTRDARIHRLFLEMVEQQTESMEAEVARS